MSARPAIETSQIARAADLPISSRSWTDRPQRRTALAHRFSGGTPTDPFSLEEHDSIAAFGKVQCNRTAGNAAADDTYVAVDRARECRARVVACAVAP